MRKPTDHRKAFSLLWGLAVGGMSFDYWALDTENPESITRLVKRLGVAWQKLLDATDEDLGIAPGRRAPLEQMLNMVRKDWAGRGDSVAYDFKWLIKRRKTRSDKGKKKGPLPKGKRRNTAVWTLTRAGPYEFAYGFES